ncbi:universal stress protein [Gloeobacter violaceus]|uniref:Glr4214 protein n=1 Tax=Gloeobacter violaceus (strain ATCC 29082 / PCC 7421) TaxID=251221 RepID=Q7NDM1_GLOVI|nr:universal stress protein [Gloeobacter violaceus]BAC92155.1 glr4214 [Gloeobacter violaceus PCC 7421]
MFRKVLAAIDSSPAGRKVFEDALEVARLHGAQLLILHVLTYEDDNYLANPTPAPGDFYALIGATAFERYLELRETMQKESLEKLTALVEEARTAGVEANHAQYAGSPEHAICKMAKEWSADLIVLGRRGRSGLSELFLGSVSNHVVHHAPCAVLVLQQLVATEANRS